VLGRLASLVSRQGARRVHTFHGHLLYGYFGKIFSAFVVITERLFALITDQLVAVSQVVKDDLLKLKVGNEAQWRVIHPGIKLGSELLSEVKKPSIKITRLIWIGRFTPIKNPLMTLLAFEHLYQNLGSSVELTMVGDGELLQECMEWADLHALPVNFPGWVKDVYPLISESHLLLISSKNEGLPVVMLEAASKGVPTLATDVGGISDFIVDNETGFFSKEDSRAFGERLLEIVKDSENILNVGRKSNRLVATNFTTQVSAREHLKLYKEIIQSPIN
jgi:glycosyltransferase involved in cell wall biosynthesis